MAEKFLGLCVSPHTISCKAYPNCNLSIRDRKEVTLSLADPLDETQFWYKFGARAQENVFVLVNKHTKQAMISTGNNQLVELVPLPPNEDGNMLWTEDRENDCDKIYTRIRVFGDSELILYAEDGLLTDGRCHTQIRTVDGRLQIYQGDGGLWKITPPPK